MTSRNKMNTSLVFKTPMTYSPYLNGDQPRPSPSKRDMLMDQLGLADTNIDSDLASSDEELEEMSQANVCSAVEYQTLKRELEEREKQRAELLLTIRGNEEKIKMYKEKLHQEGVIKKQQVSFLKRTQEAMCSENIQKVKNLESIIDEQEARIVQLESGGQSSLQSNYLGISQLIEQINQCQDDRCRLSSQLHELQSKLEKSKSDSVMELDRLRKGNSKLQERLRAVQQANEKRVSENENEIKELEANCDKLKAELSASRRLHPKQNQEIKKDSEKLQKLEKENVRLKDKLLGLEADLATTSKSVLDEQLKYQEELGRLEREKQDLTMQTREMRQNLTSIHAQQPQVVTKIQKVEVECQSTTKALAQVEEEKKKLEKQLEAAQQSSEQTKRQLSDAQQRNELLTEQLSNRTNQDGLQLASASKALAEVKVQNQQLEEKYIMYRSKADEFESSMKVEQAKNSDLKDQITHLKAKMATAKSEFKKEITLCEEGKAEALHKLQMTSQNALASYRNRCKKMEISALMMVNVVKKLHEDYMALKQQVKVFPSFMEHVVQQSSKQISEAIATVDETNKDLVRKYQKELRLRKKYHNELVELKGNIRVFCRVRPTTSEDTSLPQSNCVASFDQDDDGLLMINNKGKETVFDLDKVFSMKSTQQQVFADVCPVVTSCVDGYNVCIFAYGQTGSGKTYTMEGPDDDPGINQRALIQLFHETEERFKDWLYHIDVSVMEIYNEMPRDLLSSDPTNKLEIKMNASGEVFVPGLTRIEVKTVEDVNNVFALGHTNRATSSTNMNEHSSRSHCLLCVTVTGTNKTTGARTLGKLNLVDLAGSERIAKSGAEGARLKEAQNINKSLSSLGDVIAALKSKQQYVPYRNSKLTYLLQDSLGGDSKTLMIVQVAPIERHVGETVCSLTFAQRVRAVELGAASKKTESSEVAHLREKLSQYENSGGSRSLTPSRSGNTRSGTPSRSIPGKRKETRF